MDNVQNEEAEAAEVELPKTVKVGQREVTISLPKSLSVRFDVAAFYPSNPTRACAAALGLCWGGLGRPKAKYESTYSIGAYGGEVFDELVQRGVSPAEIVAAGSTAFVAICRSLPKADEVDKAEGNSGGQAV